MIETTAAVRAYGDLGAVLRAPAAEPKAGPEAKAGAAEAGRAFVAALDRADQATTDFAAGRADTQAMVEAIAQAEAALQTVITVRDRIVAAYQEILRMPL